MSKIMTSETLRSFAYTNEHLIAGEIRGIIVQFEGLGFSSMQGEDGAYDRELAARGVIRVVPYYNPWSWMNQQAVDYTDEILDVLEAKHLVKPKLVSCGGSMGGLCAIVFCRYSAHREQIVSCVTNCPVCDLPFHFTERPDLPRTLYSAYGTEPDFDAALRAHSPLHLAQAGELPDIEYHDIHCEADGAVNIDRHSVPFVAAMQKNRRITFDRVPERGHCDLTPEWWDRYKAYLLAPFC